jgi:hypothetical protein
MDNTRMMRVFKRAGHQMSIKTSAGISEVIMLFPDRAPSAKEDEERM